MCENCTMEKEQLYSEVTFKFETIARGKTEAVQEFNLLKKPLKKICAALDITLIEGEWGTGQHDIPETYIYTTSTRFRHAASTNTEIFLWQKIIEGLLQLHGLTNLKYRITRD